FGRPGGPLGLGVADQPDADLQPAGVGVAGEADRQLGHGEGPFLQENRAHSTARRSWIPLGRPRSVATSQRPNVHSRRGPAMLNQPGSASRFAMLLRSLLLSLCCCGLSLAGGVTGRGGLEAVAVSPDGKLVAAGGQNRVVYLLDAATLEVKRRIWLGAR